GSARWPLRAGRAWSPRCDGASDTAVGSTSAGRGAPWGGTRCHEPRARWELLLGNRCRSPVRVNPAFRPARRAVIGHAAAVTPRASTGTRLPTLQALERAARDRLAAFDWSQLPEVRRQVLEALGPVLHGGDAARLLTVLLRSHPGWDAAHRAVAAEA